MRILLLMMFAAVVACGEKAEPREPAAASEPTAPSAPTAPSTPADCASDADCIVTFLPETPMTRPEECCEPLCARRVETKQKVDQLQAAYGQQCAAVQCPRQECATQAEPVPVCREGRCARE